MQHGELQRSGRRIRLVLLILVLVAIMGGLGAAAWLTKGLETTSPPKASTATPDTSSSTMAAPPVK
jgi:hypothetical protein